MPLWHLSSCQTLVLLMHEAQPSCPRLGSALEMPYGHDGTSFISLQRSHHPFQMSLQELLLSQQELDTQSGVTAGAGTVPLSG